jgi:hypothetical protein
MTLSRLKIFLLVSVWILSLSGCGSSGSGSTSDPLSGKGQNGTGDPPTDTPTGPGTVLNYALSLTTIGSSGTSTVGSNSTVIATATLKDSSGKAVANQPVEFKELATTDSSVTILNPVVNTSSDGTAITFLQISNGNVNRDVIIQASTDVSGQLVNAASIFKIVRSAGNYIDFITTKTPTDPDGNLNHIEVSVTGVDPSVHGTTGVLQLVPLQVLDQNGLDRTLVPVTLQIGNVINCTVALKDGLSATQTVTTDNTGLAVFSALISIPTPPVGSENSCSVVYKATTPDPYSTDPSATLFSYGAYIVTLKNVQP